MIAPPGRYSPQLPNAQALFAIYDGHGGAAAASHAARHLHEILFASTVFKAGQYEQALYDAFRDEDKAMLRSMTAKGVVASGSTAVVCLIDITASKVVVANVGDSRAVLARREEVRTTDGGTGIFVRAVRLSHDHNPTNEEERARIEARGGFVRDGRVGALAVSRALGDFTYKLTPANVASPPAELRAAIRPGSHGLNGDLVSPIPHVTACSLHPVHTPFLVLGSDGLFGALPDQQLVDAVAHLRYRQHWKAPEIARHLSDTASRQYGADNVTCIVIFFD